MSTLMQCVKWNLDDLVHLLPCETSPVHQFMLGALYFILMFLVFNNSITVVCKVGILLCSKIDFAALQFEIKPGLLRK